MPKLNFDKAHGTTRDEALTKLRALARKFADQYPKLGVTLKDNNDGAVASGKGFKATFSVDDSTARILVDLSFIALPFKGRIEEGMARELEKAFA